MENIQYKKSKIETEESSSPTISIDGESVQTSQDADAGEFTAGEIPYRSFNSVKQLAEAIVDQRLQDTLGED